MPWPLLLWGAGAVATAVAGYAGYKAYEENEEEKQRAARRRAREAAEEKREEEKRRKERERKLKTEIIQDEYGECLSMGVMSEEEINIKGINEKVSVAERECIEINKELDELKKTALRN